MIRQTKQKRRQQIKVCPVREPSRRTVFNFVLCCTLKVGVDSANQIRMRKSEIFVDAHVFLLCNKVLIWYIKILYKN